MAWAIVSNDSKKYKKWTISGEDQKFIECDAVAGTIINMVVYDGVSPYKPAEGCKLVEVPDNSKIGDVIQ